MYGDSFGAIIDKSIIWILCCRIKTWRLNWVARRWFSRRIYFERMEISKIITNDAMSVKSSFSYSFSTTDPSCFQGLGGLPSRMLAFSSNGISPDWCVTLTTWVRQHGRDVGIVSHPSTSVNLVGVIPDQTLQIPLAGKNKNNKTESLAYYRLTNSINSNIRKCRESLRALDVDHFWELPLYLHLGMSWIVMKSIGWLHF